MLGRDAVISTLTKLTQSGDEADKFYAIRSLASLQATESTSELMNCLGDQDDDVCIEAATALGELRCQEAVPVLKDVIASHDLGDVKVAATASLAKIASTEAIDYLKHLILNRPDDIEYDGWDDYWDIQKRAVIAMAELGVSDATESLAQLLQSEDGQDIEVELIEVLSKTDEVGINFLLSLLDQQVPPRQMRRIIKALVNANVRQQPEVIDKITPLLLDQDNYVRLATCVTLGQLNAVSAISSLMGRFVDPDADVVAAAIFAAQTIASKLPDENRVISPKLILSLYDNSNEATRIKLLQAIKSMQQTNFVLEEQQLEFVATLLEHQDGEMVLLAAEILSQAQALDHLSALTVQIVKEDTDVRTRQRLIHFYGQLADNSLDNVAPLKSLLMDSDNVVRSGCCQVLAEMAQKDFVGDDNPAESILYRMVMGDDLVEPVIDESIEPSQDNPGTAIIAGNITADQIIPVNVIEHQAEKESEFSIDSTFNAMMARQVSDESPVEVTGQKAEQQIVEAPATSTFDEILAAKPQSVIPLQQQSQDDHLRVLMSELPSDMAEFNQVVEENLQTGDQMKYSRKKIAKIPVIDNQILATQALPYYANAMTVKLILESLRTTDICFARTLMNSLDLIIKKGLRIKGLSNSMGVAATLLHAGDPELRLLCARVLGSLKHRGALPALMDALADPDSNVRIEVVNALGNQLSNSAKRICDSVHVVRDEKNKQQIESKDAEALRLIKAMIVDPEYGVRKAVIEVLQKYQVKAFDDIIIAGGADGGALTDVAGQALRQIDVESSAMHLLSHFSAAKNSSQRRFLIKMMELLFVDLGQSRQVH